MQNDDFFASLRSPVIHSCFSTFLIWNFNDNAQRERLLRYFAMISSLFSWMWLLTFFSPWMNKIRQYISDKEKCHFESWISQKDMRRCLIYLCAIYSNNCTLQVLLECWANRIRILVKWTKRVSCWKRVFDEIGFMPLTANLLCHLKDEFWYVIFRCREPRHTFRHQRGWKNIESNLQSLKKSVWQYWSEQTGVLYESIEICN